MPWDRAAGVISLSSASNKVLFPIGTEPLSQRIAITENKAAELTNTGLSKEMLYVKGGQKGCVFDTCQEVQITK